MAEKILVVEDENHIRGFIIANLEICDFKVIEAASGEEALEMCKYNQPDVAVLDIMLPGMDGYELCKSLRAMFPDIAIIMLTAKGQHMDKIIGLDIGADDYMVKPFNPMELISRIKAILRRIKKTEKNIYENHVVVVGNLKLDISSVKLIKDDIEIELTQREFGLLKVFMENPDKAFTRDELLDAAWGEDFYGDFKTVDVHVRRIREKIEDDSSNPKYIETVWGHGYRFKKF